MRVGLMPEGGAGVIESSVEQRDEAMLRLFDEHYGALCRLAYVILGDHALAEEVVMEALVRTFSGWGRLRDPDKADFYLRRAVVNLSRSGIRRKVIERRAQVSLSARPPAGPDPDAHENSAVLWAAVRALPERQRACVVLRYYEDLPDRQIADILECSVGTVKSQLSKARAKLQAAVKDDLVEEQS